MTGRIGLAAALWVFLGGVSANAALLPPVTVVGTAWLQPLDFVSYDWNAISTVCDPTSGFCNGSLGGNDITGWTWASVDDANALFNYYIGVPALGPGPSSVDGYPSGPNWFAPIQAAGFLPTYTYSDSSRDLTFIVGKLRNTLSYDSAYAHVGRVGISSNATEGFTDVSFADTNSTVDKAFPATVYGYGAWLYQGDLSTIAVSTTDTLALVGLGLCVLGFTSRKRTILNFSILHYR